MRVWMLVRLALGGLRRTRLRVVLTSLGVAIGCGALVSMMAFALGIQAQAEAPFQQLDLLNTIEVKPKGDGDSGDSNDPDDPHGSDDAQRPADSESPKDEQDAPVLDDAAIERMEALEGVTTAYPDFRIGGLKIVCGQKSADAIAVGVPRQMPLAGSMEEMLVAGGFFSVGDNPEVILGERLARELGFDPPSGAVGAVVKLEATGLSPEEAATFKFRRAEYAVTVVGVFEPPHVGRRFSSRAILLPVEFMKEVPGVRFDSALESLRAGKSAPGGGYQRCLVRVKHPSQLASVEAQIQEMGFKTYAVLNRLEKMRAFFIFIDVLLAAVGTVALVVAALGIVNTLVMSVLERTQEIGIYKAIGASDGDLLVLFLAEAGIIGFLGGLGGLLLGSGVSWILEAAANAYARSHDVTSHLEIFAFPGWLLAGTVLFAVVISVLAGVYPAMRAARVDPIRALRGN